MCRGHIQGGLEESLISPSHLLFLFLSLTTSSLPAFSTSLSLLFLLSLLPLYNFPPFLSLSSSALFGPQKTEPKGFIVDV